ncbi:MAG: hypothetical protein U0996_18740 [Planctomycetaceae bacterium]
MRRGILAAALVITGLQSTVAVAHEGHGHTSWQTGVMHYVLNPIHAIPVLLVGCVAVLVGRMVANRAGRRRDDNSL